jgi:hypothetical protein
VGVLLVGAGVAAMFALAVAFAFGVLAVPLSLLERQAVRMEKSIRPRDSGTNPEIGFRGSIGFSFGWMISWVPNEIIATTSRRC